MGYGDSSMSSLKLKHSGSNSMSIEAPATNPASNLALKLPATIGSANQFLKNSGTAGTLGWSSVVEDSSGNVGIGTSSPQEILHVKAASETVDSRDGVIFGSTDSLAADKGLPLVWAAHIGTDADYGIANICGRKENSTSDNGAGYLQFGTGNAAGAISERVRITSSGFLKAKGNCASYQSTTGTYHELMHDTGGQTILDMQHNSSNGFGMILKFNHQSTSNYAFQVYDFANSSARMFIRCDGDLENANNSYGSISDVKLKENIVDAKSQWNDIKALKVRNFNFKADKNKTKLLGLVAQEAEEVCPSLVKSQPDLDLERNDLGTTTKVLKYSIVYMKAIKALQEAQARIETLETKVAALEAA